MKALGLSQNALARALKVPPRRINEIVLGKRAITADTALWLSQCLGTSAELWTGLQADYDLRVARHEKEHEIRHQVQRLSKLTMRVRRKSDWRRRGVKLVWGFFRRIERDVVGWLGDGVSGFQQASRLAADSQAPWR